MHHRGNASCISTNRLLKCPDRDHSSEYFVAIFYTDRVKYFIGNSRTKNDMRYFEFDGNYRIHLICRDSALNWHQLPSEIIWLQGSITTSLCTRMKVCNLPFSLYSIASFNLIVCSYSKSWKLSVVLAFNVRLINHEWLNNQ